MKPGELYEFVVVAVDGNTMMESDIAEIEASSTGTSLNCISIQRRAQDFSMGGVEFFNRLTGRNQ